MSTLFWQFLLIFPIKVVSSCSQISFVIILIFEGIHFAELFFNFSTNLPGFFRRIAFHINPDDRFGSRFANMDKMLVAYSFNAVSGIQLIVFKEREQILIKDSIKKESTVILFC